MGGSLCGRELCARKKGGDGVGKTKRGKGSKWVVVVDGAGLPLGGRVVSANPAEVTLLEGTLATIRVPRKGRGRPKKRPKRVIADKGYDSDPLRERLWHQGIELLVPGRKGRLTYRHDGRKLRRYQRRWKIERTFAWLQCFRHLVVRYDRYLMMYAAFFHLACVILVLRKL
jgi:transposase